MDGAASQIRDAPLSPTTRGTSDVPKTGYFLNVVVRQRGRFRCPSQEMHAPPHAETRSEATGRAQVSQPLPHVEPRMKNLVFALALGLWSAMSWAQSPRTSPPPLSDADVGRLVSTAVEATLMQRVKALLPALYQELRRKGEPPRVAAHSLLNLGLPGVDIAAFGKSGQEVRQHLENLAVHFGREERLTEPAAVALAVLTLNELVQSLVLAEKPAQIHIAIEGEDGSATTRRSEDLYAGDKPRHRVRFTELVDARGSQACTVEAMTLAESTYFTVTCHAAGEGSFPQASTTSECAISNDRFRAARLTLIPSKAPEPREVFVWCSSLPR